MFYIYFYGDSSGEENAGVRAVPTSGWNQQLESAVSDIRNKDSGISESGSAFYFSEESSRTESPSVAAASSLEHTSTLVPESRASPSHIDMDPSALPTSNTGKRKGKKSGKKGVPYYPPDHISDSRLLSVTKVLNARLFKWIASLQSVIPEEMNRYAGYEKFLTSRQSPRDYITSEEKQEINSLSGSARKRKTDKVMKECVLRMKEAEQKKRKQLEQLYHSLVHYSPDEATCDGCEFRSLPSVSMEETVTPGTRYFVGNQEKPSLPKDVFISETTTTFEITAIFVTTIGRIDFLSQLLFRWRGFVHLQCITHRKIIVVAYISTTEHLAFRRFIATHFLPDRLTLIEKIFLPRKNPEFPVNSLRNLGISHCVTSHYIVLDMDVWLSESSYDLLKEIPRFVLMQPKTAIILPLFFFDRSQFLDHCSSVYSCLLLSFLVPSVIVRALDFFPKTKQDLTACIANSVCLSSKMGIRTHVLPSVLL